MRRAVQIAMLGVMATPFLYQAVWPVVFRLWPDACTAPDGSVLLCIVGEQYTQPRDLTALGISMVLGVFGAVALHLMTVRRASA